MKVLSVAYPLMKVSEDSGGGAEQILHLVERGLVEAGHTSVVIAAEGSSIAGRLIATPVASGEITEDVRFSAQHSHREAIETVLRRERIDLVHFHGLDFFEYLPPDAPPTLATLHLPIEWYPPSIFAVPGITMNVVSHSQSASHPATAGLPVICNGVDLSRYGNQSASREFLLILARICPEKGIDIALRVAHRLDLPLCIAGPIYPFESHWRYFREQVEPLLDARRTYIGAIGLAQKIDLLANARCVLIPSLAAETSSLVAMEASCSGTPVIAYRSGALPEVVEHAVSGFIVDSEEEMAESVAKLKIISAATCRSLAETRFDSRRMVNDYLKLYERLNTSRTRDSVSAPKANL